MLLLSPSRRVRRRLAPIGISGTKKAHRVVITSVEGDKAALQMASDDNNKGEGEGRRGCVGGG